MASLTIPAVVKDYQNKELRTKFKSVYSKLSQASKELLTDNGGTINGLCNAHSQAPAMWCSKLKCVKTCGNITADRTDKCWHADGVVTNLNGDVVYNTQGAYWGAVLIDGTHMTLGCSPTNILLDIDINGFKGPNSLGKDIFPQFKLTDNGLILPASQYDPETYCKPGETTSPADVNGVSCVKKILMGIDY